MNDQLKIESILGYVANDNPLRASRDGKAFEGMIPAPAWSEVTVKRNGSVNDTVNEMRKIINHYYYQAAKVAPLLKGKTLYETCQNIWDFLFYQYRYNEDTPNKEELRTFSRAFSDRKIGIDCDDFSISAGSLLRCLNIPFYIRIARYPHKNYFQHVYVVVPVRGQEYITIDGVLDEYDAEKTPIETKDFLAMSNNNLNGIDISVLGDLNDDMHNEISGILSGEDFNEVAGLEGTGTEPSEAQVLGSLRRHLMRTRRVIEKRPDLVSDTEHPESFMGMVDYALKYWDTPQRDAALGVLEAEEDRLNTLEGLSGAHEEFEGVDLFYGLGDNQEYNVLGRARRKRGFFKKIRAAAKKIGKKVIRAVIRFNPLTATIRGAVLLALKINLFKVSSKLKWGYLTKEEAMKSGFDPSEWAKVKTRLAKAENMFVRVLGGKAENFKRAILTGRAGKLSGPDLGLGIVATAAATASVTAAIPFITRIIKLLKGINFPKLIGRVAKNRMNGRKRADNDEPTEEGGSAMPEGGETTDTPADGEQEGSEGSENSEESGTSGDEENTESSENADNGEGASSEGEATESSESSEGGENSEGEDVSGFKDTLKTFYDKFGKKIIMKRLNQRVNTTKKKKKPVKKTSTATRTVAPDTAENASTLPVVVPKAEPPVTTPTVVLPEVVVTPEKKNIFSTAIDWVKENPGKSVLIGAGAVFVLGGLMYASKPKRSPALSGVRGGRKHKGKSKKHPPKTISSHKRKGKGKGGKGGKKFKL